MNGLNEKGERRRAALPKLLERAVETKKFDGVFSVQPGLLFCCFCLLFVFYPCLKYHLSFWIKKKKKYIIELCFSVHNHLSPQRKRSQNMKNSPKELGPL